MNLRMSDELRSQPAFAGPPPRALAVGRLGIVEQLLTDLETATHGGERYTMAKIVSLLREATGDTDARLSELQRRSLKLSLAELAREQDRMLPDRLAFVTRAQRMADMLSIC